MCRQMPHRQQKRKAYHVYTHQVIVPTGYEPVYHERPDCEGVAFFYCGDRNAPHEESKSLSALGRPMNFEGKLVCTTCNRFISNALELYMQTAKDLAPQDVN